MRKSTLMTALAVAAMGFSSLVMAEGGERDNRTRPGPNQQQMHRQPAPNYSGTHGALGRALRADPTRRDGNNGYQGRGAGPNQNFYRGGRLPQEYRSRQYVVDDWRGHHLNAPPRGYQWVQTGGDYVLVAIATGIIAQILLSQ